MIWPYRSKWTVKVRFWIWQWQWLSFLTHQLDLDLHLAATIIIISYPSTQWAAVITWLCEIREPPQKDVFLSSTICERVIPIHVMSSFLNTHKSCHPRPLIFNSILSTDNTPFLNISFSTRYGGGIIWNEKRCFFCQCHTERHFFSILIPVSCGQSLGPATAKRPTLTFWPIWWVISMLILPAFPGQVARSTANKL